LYKRPSFHALNDPFALRNLIENPILIINLKSGLFNVYGSNEYIIFTIIGQNIYMSLEH